MKIFPQLCFENDKRFIDGILLSLEKAANPYSGILVDFFHREFLNLWSSREWHHCVLIGNYASEAGRGLCICQRLRLNGIEK